MSASDAGTFDRIASPYDRGMAPLEKLWLRRMRARLLPWARGRVLEVGVGTGVNLPLYPDRVSVVAIDESAEMLVVAQQRALSLVTPASPVETSGRGRNHPEYVSGEYSSAEYPSGADCGTPCHVHLARVDAERLAFPDGAFDTVVTSLVLCSVVEPERALGELRRVLSPRGGRLLLLEHMRPWNGPFALLVDLANVPWYAFNGRCHLNRRTQHAVAAAGFSIEHVEGAVGGFLRLIVATR